MITYIILGIAQGLTEFLPVSSSAHLVILQKLMGFSGEGIALIALLHLGTVLSLIVFFFSDLIELCYKPKQIAYILLVTAITSFIGLLGKDFFESLFSSVKLAALALIITGIILFLASKFIYGRRNNIRAKDCLVLGITQAIAIIPGISRSGITLSTLLFRGIEKQEAFRFSFLVAIPVIFGANLLEAKNIGLALKADFTYILAGVIFSFLSGIFALVILKKVLQKAKLHYFGVYCIVIAVLTLIFVK